MKDVRRLGTWQHVSFSIYWFPISYLWASLNAIILPYLILNVAHESRKGTALALVAGTGLLIAVLVQPAAGAASDAATFRWGRRRPFVVAGSLFDVVFLVALGLASSYPAVLLAYVGLQIASNVAHGPYQGLIPDLVPEGERGRASGFMGIAQVAGTAAGLLVTGHFIQEGQMALALGSIMLTIVAGMLLTVSLVPDRPAPVKVKMEPLAAIRRTFDREVFQYPDFLWLLVSRFFILLGLDSIRDFALYYLRDVLQMPHPAQATSRLMAVIVFSSMLTVLPAGYLSDRLGRKRIVIASAICGVIGGILFLTSSSYREILLYGVLVGMAFGSFLSVDWAFATDLIPKSQAGRFLGISNIATAGASAGSFILGGPAIDIFNARTPDLGYKALLVLVICYFIIGTLALFKVREVVAVDDAASRAALAGEPPIAPRA